MKMQIAKIQKMFDAFYKQYGKPLVVALKEKADKEDQYQIAIQTFEKVLIRFGSRFNTERRKLLETTNGSS
jgi:cytochrome c peroxidase